MCLGMYEKKKFHFVRETKFQTVVVNSDEEDGHDNDDGIFLLPHLTNTFDFISSWKFEKKGLNFSST